ncbi:hypothetical protein [Liquorilactobacillus capillatus]|uniref:Polymerase n=1 Tax=Liquorilactobacillus capillatus DSM 19910 TaxID=1423731 RepID=A0A0R1MAM9_9LACO|nr:hypothetical protein [Liquorilactobacillus capillatus]KRL02130.1 hypothetical protein FC81_GL000893 [Liquorilactobacillus capillatus DSM 19910]
MMGIVAKRNKIRDYFNKKISNPAEKLYFIGFIVYALVNYLRGTMFTQYLSSPVLYDFMKVSAIFVVIKILLFDSWELKDLTIFLLLGILIEFTCRVSYDYDIYYYGILILGAKGIKFSKILKTYLILIGAALILTIIASQVGLVYNITFGRHGTPIVRYALGAVYPTDFAARVFYLMLFYTVFKKFKLSLPEYISLGAVTVAMYVLTDTRLDTVLMLLVILVAIFYKYVVRFISYVSAKIMNIMIVAFIMFNIVLAYLFVPSNPIFKIINKILSQRLVYGNMAFKRYNVPLLGQFVPQMGNGGLHHGPYDYFFIDSSFIRVLMMHGIWAFLFTMILIMFLSYKFISKKYFILEIALLLVILSSVIDQHMWEISFNIIFVGLFAQISDKYKESETDLKVVK